MFDCLLLYEMQLLLCVLLSDLGAYYRMDHVILLFSLYFLLDSVCLTQK